MLHYYPCHLSLDKWWVFFWGGGGRSKMCRRGSRQEYASGRRRR